MKGLKMKILLSLIVFAVSCEVTQRQEVGGDATVRIIVEYPQVQACFDDPRIVNFEQLRDCLEFVTNMKWTVDAAGEIVEVITEVTGVENTYVPGNTDGVN